MNPLIEYTVSEMSEMYFVEKRTNTHEKITTVAGPFMRPSTAWNHAQTLARRDARLLGRRATYTAATLLSGDAARACWKVA